MGVESRYSEQMHPWLDRLLLSRRSDERLREFAETEAFGGADLVRAAERTADPWVRRQLVRHAEDEARHAELLGGPEGSGAVPLGAALAGDTEARPGVDLDELGELGFLAFVHVSEEKATREFARVGAVDADNAELFQRILADERRHVAWTATALERFRQQGRGAEVSRALTRERWRQRIRPLRWLSGRLAEGISAILLTILYFIALPPFTRLAPAPPRGWQPVAPGDLRRES